jgi:hypothetical protein
LNIIAYITVNILLFTSWYIFLFRHKEHLSFVDRIISTFILGVTQIIATEMLLGVVFGNLYAAQLFWLNVSVSLVVFIYSISTGSTIIYPPSSLFSSGWGKKISSGQVLLKDILTEISGRAAWFWTVIKSDLILFFIFILFFISVCWIIFLGYLFPSYTWDALWYHLPIAGYIMQSGTIGEIPNNSFIEQFINIFPKNIELFFIWNIIFLKNDILTDLSQLLFTIAGVLAIYSIAVKLNIKKRAAIYSSLLFFFTPIVILQSTTNYVDVAVSVLFLAAVNFLMDDMPCRGGFETSPCEGHAERKFFHKRNITTVMAGLTAGILLGSKGSGPLFIAVLSAAVIIREFLEGINARECGILKWKKIATKTFQLYFFFFFIPVIFMGGYWYIKNWIIYGNPVYPMEISIFNNTIFKGLYQGIIEPAPVIIDKLHPVTRPLYVWLDKVEYYLYDSRLGGFGPIWFILFLPSIVFSFVYALMRRHYRFILLLIIVSSAFLMYPRNWNPRYVIFIVGLGALSFGIVFDYFQERNDILRVIAIILAGYTFLTSNSPCVTPKQIKKFIQLPAAERVIAAYAPFNIDLHARQDYGYWTWINRNISQGETLAYTYDPLFLSPMWNSAFSNKMVYIKSDDYKQWLKKLGEHKVTYVLVRKNSEEDKWIENERKIFSAVGWMTALKEKYKIVYTDDNYKIAKFITSVPGR